MVLIFHPRFEEPIRSGRKTQTIRPPRKNPIIAGAAISLRRWKDKAYRSPQVEIAAVQCLGVIPIIVTTEYVRLGETPASYIGSIAGLNSFALRDGFDSWADMLEYFKTGGYGLPFQGDLIQWEPR